ncbi:hydroxyisourate hydrolase [Ureibacillus thermophilus]|uniref:hydroxyisourate hydrolase n=1 Tax=Ureibacillus thermophilus TaxID=367743 RepID=UPI00361B85E1
MPSLSTHVLDLVHGKPAQNVKIELYCRTEEKEWKFVKTVTTNADGRTDEKLIAEDDWQPTTYQLVFYIADYFQSLQTPLANSPFLTTVPVQFTMEECGGHYHVPLLVSPWGYQVYRGS